MDKDPGKLKNETEEAERRANKSKSDTHVRRSGSEEQKSVKLDSKVSDNSLEEFVKEATSVVSIPEQFSQKQEEKKSFALAKIADLENALTFDNIQKQVLNIYQPDEPGKSATDDGPGDSTAEPPPNQLSSAMAAMFIVSCTTGTGMTNLAYSLKNSSWFGVFFIILLGVNALYGGMCTGWSWTIMENKWPEYKAYRRVPYEDIAHRAVGIWMKYIIAIFIDVTLLGTCTFYALSISQSIEAMSQKRLTFCWTLLVTICVLTPFMGFSYYRNMKFMGVLDTVLSLLFALLVIIGIFIERRDHGMYTYSDPSYESVALAFASFSFSYGNGPLYPSIMTDMEDRRMFPHACGTAYLIILLLYIIMPIIGYAAYGDGTLPDITDIFFGHSNMREIGIVIEIIQIIQVGTSFVIFFIPTMHSFEERFNCPIEFCWRRIFIRLTAMLFILLLALGVPFIGKFVDFLGATFMNFLTYFFPPVFYVCLLNQQVSLFSKKSGVTKKDWFMLIEMILLSVVVGIISTYSSVKNYLISPPNRQACYFNMSA